MPNEKIAGAPCENCNAPFIQGPKGVYCKPCFIAWKNKNDGGQPQQTQTSGFVKAVPKERDYEAEGRGKVRYGVVMDLIKIFRAEKPELTITKCLEAAMLSEPAITNYIMTGKRNPETQDVNVEDIPF